MQRWQRFGLIVVAALLLAGAAEGLVFFGEQPAAPGPTRIAPTSGQTPARTAVVANLPFTQTGTWSWAPDGRHLLVSGDDGSTVYDTWGKAIGRFGPGEGWLDESHLVDGDGHAWALGQTFVPKTEQYPWYGWVVASGHGAAAIVESVPACICEPMIGWYRNGRFDRLPAEKTLPYGWSPDGKLVVVGHLQSSIHTANEPWRVDVRDFASGLVRVSISGGTGQMAFNPGATRLAVQTGPDVQLGNVADGSLTTIKDVSFLGWLDDGRLYATTGKQVELVDATTGQASPTPDGMWRSASPAGPAIAIAADGSVDNIAAADGSTLLDLSSATLVARSLPFYGGVYPQAHWWSPDGQMLALPSTDGTALALIAVHPGVPGAVGTALPTPVALAKPLSPGANVAMPGFSDGLVADAARNAFWFLSGDEDAALSIDRYDISTGVMSATSVAGIDFHAGRSKLVLAPDGRLWIAGDYSLDVYDPDTSAMTKISLPPPEHPQSDPKSGKPDPWIGAIAFDPAGNAYVARNWVRFLSIVDASLQVESRTIDVSDGFAMTGEMAVAGNWLFVVADPSQDFGFSVALDGSSRSKFSATHIVAVGDRVLAAGQPPVWFVGAEGNAPMTDPALPSANLVAAGPGETCVLYSAALDEVQWRDKDGKVSLQATLPAGLAPVALALDGQGGLWIVDAGAGGYSLVQLRR